MSNLWNRYVSLQVGEVLITSDQLDIDFSIKGSNSSDANTSEIVVWNLSSATRAKIKPDLKVFIKAGYQGDYGDLFTGVVKKISDEQDQADLKTRITALNQVYATGLSSKKYPRGTAFSTIIHESFQASEIPVGVIDDQGLMLDEDYSTDPNAKVNLDYCLNKINGSEKKHKEAKYYVESGAGYFVTADYVRSAAEKIVISSDTGLIETLPEEPDDGTYTRSIRCFLQWRVTTDSLIELKSKMPGASGTYKVVEYSHTGDTSDFTTEMKVKES